MRITVLGAGLIGRVIARELASEEGASVSVFDADPDALERVGRETHASIHQADLSRREVVASAVADADAVVGALPGALGFAMLRAVVEAGKPVADISFSAEDPLQLEALARERGATAVVDCGISPGLSNFFIGRAARDLNEVDDARIYVGGLPFERRWPYEYALVFSASDVVEEYVRPARILENGQLVTRPALSEVERIDVPGVGTLEGFLTDGLRTPAGDLEFLEVRSELQKLPEPLREALMLKYFEGLSSAEAGDVLGCSAEAIRARVCRAKSILARRLNDTRRTR